MAWDHRQPEPEIIDLDRTGKPRRRWIVVLVISIAVIVVAGLATYRLTRDPATVEVGEPVYVGDYTVEVDVAVHNQTNELLGVTPANLGVPGLRVVGVEVVAGPQPTPRELPEHLVADDLSAALASRYLIGVELPVEPKMTSRFVLRWRVTDCATAKDQRPNATLQVGPAGGPADTSALDLGSGERLLPKICGTASGDRGRPTVASQSLRVSAAANLMAKATVTNRGGRPVEYAGAEAGSGPEVAEYEPGATEPREARLVPGATQNVRVQLFLPCRPSGPAVLRLRYTAADGSGHGQPGPVTVRYAERWPSADDRPACR